MEVAKSYEDLPRLSEPFERDGKMYITIELKSGKPKDVRWYGEVVQPEGIQKHMLGFDKGYITIFKGVKPEHEEWFCESSCRFAVCWGWYVPSTEEVPEDLPNGVSPVRLDWAPMDDGRGWLAAKEVVSRHVQSTLYAITSVSRFQGEIGSRIERLLDIYERDEKATKWGTTFTYYFRDADNNLYIWKTSAKDWDIGTTHRLKGTVKEQFEEKGENYTVLTRCLEII